MRDAVTPRRPKTMTPAAPRPCRATAGSGGGDGPGRGAEAGDDAGRGAAGDGAGQPIPPPTRPAAPSDTTAGPPTAAAVQEMLKSNVGHVLARREAEILKLRYGIDDEQTYTAEEVGRIFRVTPERVCQIEAKAIRKLKRANATVLAIPRPCRRARAAAGEEDAVRPLPPPRPLEPGKPAVSTPAELLAVVQAAMAGLLKAADLPQRKRLDPSPAVVCARVFHRAIAAVAQAPALCADLPPQRTADPLADLNNLARWCLSAMVLSGSVGCAAGPRALAKKHGVPVDPMRKRLERWRRDHRDCFMNNAARGPGEPEFVYWEQEVISVIEALKTSSRRPGQKNPAEVSSVSTPPGPFPAAARVHPVSKRLPVGTGKGELAP